MRTVVTQSNGFRILIVGILLLAQADLLTANPFPGERSSYHGYERFDFVHNDRAAIIVRPETTALGRPWVWKARFFEHFPQVELALLEQGFHLVYIDVVDLFGAPSAVAIWNDYYAYLTGEFEFSTQAALIGLSRGGLILYNWASANPEKVACIYADAPVCDINSWPRRHSSEANWQKCLVAYGLTETEALTARVNPIDNLVPLAGHRVPLLHVVGEADTVVPVAENTDRLVKRYRALDGSIDVIRKPDSGHHPHSLEDPTPIVDFILEHASVHAK